MKHPCWHSVRILAFSLLAITSLGVVQANATSSSTMAAVGPLRREPGRIRRDLPLRFKQFMGPDGATYTWQFTSQPAGTYEVFMWWSGWSSRTTNASVAINHRDGSNTISVNQKLNAGKWNSLGQFYFNGTGSVTITAAERVDGQHVRRCGAVRQRGRRREPASDGGKRLRGHDRGGAGHDQCGSNDTDDVGVDASTVAVVGAPANGTAVRTETAR